MKTKFGIIPSVVIVSALLVGPTEAYDKPGAFYIGGMVGNASYDYEDVGNSTTGQFYVGYRDPDSHFGIEIAVIDLGEADIDSLPGWSLNPAGTNVSVVYHNISDIGQLGYLFKLGLYSIDTDLVINGVTVATDSGSGLSLGGGLVYPVNRHLSFRAELQGFVGVKDFADNSSVFSGNVGVDVQF